MSSPSSRRPRGYRNGSAMKAGILALLCASGARAHELRGGAISNSNVGDERDAAKEGDGHPPAGAVGNPCAGSDDSCAQRLGLVEPSLHYSPLPRFDVPQSPPATLTNQIICGYQGWFSYPGDGAPVDGWKHWFKSSASAKTVQAKDLTVDLYPVVDEYDDEDLVETGIPMRDGTHAKFYSAVKPNVVLKHFEWMATYGITGVFHSRFVSGLGKANVREWKTRVLRNVRDAAEATGRAFAVSYDLSGEDGGALDDLRADWVRLVDEEGVAGSGRYLRQDGRPVLSVYGIGFKSSRVSDTKRLADLIAWFQRDAAPRYRAFLVGGVPGGWRERVRDSREEPAWEKVYDSLDGIQPWHVGRWHTPDLFQKYYAKTIAPDAEYCNDKGILYMPTMWPGFSWHNLQSTRESRIAKAVSSAGQLGGFLWRRLIPSTSDIGTVWTFIWRRVIRHASTSTGTVSTSRSDKTAHPINAIPRLGGNFMWSQAHRYVADPNINTIWMAQFDEVNEGTAIFKVAATRRDLPAEGSWLALGDDGQSLPSDWYLRLCGEAQKMLEGKIALNPEIPIQPFPAAGAIQR